VVLIGEAVVAVGYGVHVRRVQEEQGLFCVPVLDTVPEVQAVDVYVHHSLADEGDFFPDRGPSAAASSGAATIKSPSFSGIPNKPTGDTEARSNGRLNTVDVRTAKRIRELTAPLLVEFATVQ
jgi:hypothetical protein